jgi:intracellular sulfur oxidation DsrE/DsrF family protein
MAHGIWDARMPHQRPGVLIRRRMLAWGAVALVLSACVLLMAFAVQRPQADPRLVYPRIHDAGGVLPVGAYALMPSATAEHRLYVDIDSTGPSHGPINVRLHTAAKLLNLYALAGVPDDKVHMVLLFYGNGVDLALSDAAYARKFGHPNPNAGVLAQLRQAHVRMVVCAQALGHQHFDPADLGPGMTLALSALTTREELQAAGYKAVPKEPSP